MNVYIDKKFKFAEVFNPETGFYLRSDVFSDATFAEMMHVKNPKDLIEFIIKNTTSQEPFMRSMPSLIDVGIMGHCLHGTSGLCKVGCYQSGGIKSLPNMNVDDFKSICEQCTGVVQQMALGGRGDPNMHEDFKSILKVARNNDIVPNYTTSGLRLTSEMVGLTKDYCGSVAVSWYNRDSDGYTVSSIKDFLKAKVKTNIHFVLSKESIDEAKDRLLNHGFPEVNAVVFLLYKPVGQGVQKNVLTKEDIKPFMEAVDQAVNTSEIAIGFDSCCVPFLLKNTKEIGPESIISCDAGLFSMYISDDLVALPCSFDQDRKYGVSLKTNSVYQAWNSSQFRDVRNIHASKRDACLGCSQQRLCKTCPILPDLNYCQG